MARAQEEHREFCLNRGVKTLINTRELIFSKSAKATKTDPLARVHHNNVCANNNAEEPKTESNHFVHVQNPDYSELKEVETDWHKSCSGLPEL